MSNPLVTYRTRIPAEWVDYNGHLRDAFYLLVFSYATDALMEVIGLDEGGRAETGHTLYTLECHLNFLAEVKLDEAVEVRTQVLGVDTKRLHIHHSLHRPDEPVMLAASEQMLMNVEAATARSCAFAPRVAERVGALFEGHRACPLPAYVGRVIGLPSSR